MNSAVPTQFLDVVAPVHAGGWSPLPLYAPHAVDHNGEPRHGAGKAPLIAQWQHLCDRRLDLVQLQNSVLVRAHDVGGLGVACGFGGVFGVDVDVDDEALSYRVHALAARVLGPSAPVRYGRRPRRMLVYRMADGAPVQSQSRAYETGHKVEIIGRHKQFVAYGIHPRTGTPYEWEGGFGPHNMAVSDLPEVDADRLAEFLAQLPEVLGACKSGEVTVDASSSRQWTPAAAGSADEILDQLAAAAYGAREAWIYDLGLNNLRRSGSAFSGQATFRGGSETTSIKIGRQTIVDWGDAAGGKSYRGYRPIGFVQRCLDIDFRRAMEWLGERVGMPDVWSKWVERRVAEGQTTAVQGEDDSAPDVFEAVAFDRAAPYINAARQHLDHAIECSVLTLQQWNQNRTALPPRLGIRAREGSGKSAMMRHEIASMYAQASGPMPPTLFSVPSLKLAHEAAGAYDRLRHSRAPLVVHGREAKNEAGEQMCQRADEVSMRYAAGGGGGGNPCGGCPYYVGCKYLAQFERVAEVDVIFAAGSVLTSEMPRLQQALESRAKATGQAPLFAIITDESIAAGFAEVTEHRLDVVTGDNEVDGVLARFMGICRDVVTASQLQKKGFRAPEPIPRRMIDEAGLDASTVMNAWARAEGLRISIDRDVAAGTAGLAAHANMKALSSASKIFAELHSALTSPMFHAADVVQTIQVKPIEQKVSVAPHKPLTELARQTPIISLDADLLPPEQMRRLLPGYQEVFSSDARDGIGVTRLQITGTPGTRSSLQTPATVAQIGRVLRWLGILSGEAGALLCRPKTVQLDPAGFDVATFGKVRGLDTFNGVPLVAVVGNQLPSPRDAEQLAAAVFRRPVEMVHGEDGKAPWYNTGLLHPDAGVNAIFRSTAGEQRQAAARGRPADVGPDGRQLIVYVGDAVFMGDGVDKRVRLGDLDLGNYADGMADGVIAESSVVMGALAGWDAADVERARVHPPVAIKALRGWKPEGQGGLRSPLVSIEGNGVHLDADAAPPAAHWHAVMVQPVGKGSKPSRAWVKTSTPTQAEHIILVRLQAAGVHLKRCAALGYTLADAGADLLHRRPTDEERAAWEADRRLHDEAAPLQAYPYKLAADHRDVVDFVPEVLASTTIDVDAIEAAKAMQQERDDENAELVLLYAIGSASDETIAGFLGLDWESWSSLPSDVRSACEHFARGYPDRYPAPPVPEPQDGAEVIRLPERRAKPSRAPTARVDGFDGWVVSMVGRDLTFDDGFAPRVVTLPANDAITAQRLLAARRGLAVVTWPLVSVAAA